MASPSAAGSAGAGTWLNQFQAPKLPSLVLVIDDSDRVRTEAREHDGFSFNAHQVESANTNFRSAVTDVIEQGAAMGRQSEVCTANTPTTRPWL